MNLFLTLAALASGGTTQPEEIVTKTFAEVIGLGGDRLAQ